MEYSEISEKPIRVDSLSLRSCLEEENFLKSLPADIYSYEQFSSPNLEVEASSVMILSPILLNNDEIIWALVEYSIQKRSDAYFYHPNIIYSSEHEETLIRALNKLEPVDFWNESEAHKNIYNFFIKESKVHVFQGEGQSVRGKNLLLGTQIGPNRHNLEALIHEMSHLIEIDDQRALKSGWGFNYGKPQSIMGRTYYEPETYQATLRECRTLAIQLKIHEKFGLNSSLPELVNSLQFMPDWCLIPGKTDEKRFDFLIGKVLEYSADFNFESIITEWRRKQELIGL